MDFRDSLNKNKDNQIDLFELFRLFWLHRSYIIKITFIFFATGLFISFGSTKEYKSEVTLLPEIQSRDGGASNMIRQLGGLSSLVGIDISGLGGLSGIDAISPKLYPEVVSSLPFLYQLLYTEVEVPTLDTVTTVFCYLNELRKKSIIEYIEKYTIGLPASISLFLKKKKGTIPFQKIEDDKLFKLTFEEEIIIKELNKRIKSNVDQKTGIISIKSEFPDAVLAALIADKAYNYLTEYISVYRLEKVRKNLDFVNELNNNAENDFRKAQKELALYRDENKNIISASVKSEEERLQARYNLKFNVYNSLSQQLEQAKIKVQEETPVFKVLNPVQVMNKKSKPKRMLIITVMIFIGAVAGMGIIFFRNMYNTHFNEEIK